MKILLAVGIAVIAIAALGTAGFLTSVESATVDITLPAWKLDSWTTVHGAPVGGDFKTQRAQVTLTDSVTGTATGSVSTGGSYATGYVTLTYHCYVVACAVSPAPRGALVCRIPNPPTNPQLCYVLQATATCLCGESVPIRATNPGLPYNSAAGTINVPGFNEPGAIVYVYNAAPITGGTDPTYYPVVSQSDINAASASVSSQLGSDLQSALQVKAGGLIHVVPDIAPQMTVTSNVAAGAHTRTFQVTATGSLGATEFLDSDAQALIARGIDRWVPKGLRLNGAPVLTDYQVASADGQGNVTVTGAATDYLVPSYSLEALRSQLRGVSVDAARAMIEAAVPASRVVIHLTPSASPFLPLNSARISFSIAVRAATPV